MANLSSFYQLFGELPTRTLKGLDPTSSSSLFANARGQDISLLASSGIEQRGGVVLISGGRGGSTSGSNGGGVSLYGGDSIAASSQGGGIQIYGGDSDVQTGYVTISAYYAQGAPDVAPTITLGSFSGTTGGVVSITSGKPASGSTSGDISITSANGVGSNSGSGDISFSTGNAQTNASSGEISVSTGTSTGNQPTGRIVTKTGSSSGSADSGYVEFSTGLTYGTGNSGFVLLSSGDSNQSSGYISLNSGYGITESGYILIQSGFSDTISGEVSIISGDGGSNSGDVSISTGSAESTGDWIATTGQATSGSSGSIYLNTGTATTQSGSLDVFTEDAPITGDLTIQTGTASSGNAGDIYLIAGSGTTHAKSGSLDLTAKSVIWGTNSPTNSDVLLQVSDGGLNISSSATINMTSLNGQLKIESSDSILFQAPYYTFDTPESTHDPVEIGIGGNNQLLLPDLTSLTTENLSNINLTFTNVDIDLETGFYLGVSADQTILNTDNATIRSRTPDQAVQLTIGDGVYTGLALNAISKGSLSGVAEGDVSITSTTGEVSLIAPQGVNLISTLGEIDIAGANINLTGFHPTNPTYINVSSTNIPTTGPTAVDNRLLQVGASGILSALGFKFQILEVGVSATVALGNITDLYFNIGAAYTTPKDRLIYSLEINGDVALDHQFYFRGYTTNPVGSSPCIQLHSGTNNFGSLGKVVRIYYLIFNS